MSGPFDWLSKADGDLEMARRALESKWMMLDQAAFHVQQGAEKSIKALLVHLGIPVVRTHKISDLVAMIPQGHRLARDATKFISTEDWAVAPRYPGIGLAPPAPLAKAQDMNATITEIERFQDNVCRDLPQPATTIVRALMASNAKTAGRRDEVGLWVGREGLEAALDDAAYAKRDATAALRLLFGAGWQPGYEKSGKTWALTGEVHVGRFAAEHVAERMTSAKLPFDKFKMKALAADAIIGSNPSLAKGFEALAAEHEATLRIIRKKEEPGRDGPCR